MEDGCEYKGSDLESKLLSIFCFRRAELATFDCDCPTSNDSDDRMPLPLRVGKRSTTQAGL